MLWRDSKITTHINKGSSFATKKNGNFFPFLILAGVTGSVNLNIIGTVNTAVYISTGGEEEFGCGGALMYIGDEFRVSVSCCL